MSKLADHIRKASRKASAPLGFAAAAARAPDPTLVCVVHLSGHDPGKAADAAGRGVALLLDGLDPGKARDAVEKAGKAPVGARLQKASRGDVSALREAGLDFVVLDTSAMAEAMLDEGIGYVLTLGKDADDTTLRLLGDLDLDALIVPAPDAALTLARLLELRRVAVLARTPLLTEVSPEASAFHLQALRESGVAGIIVDSPAAGKLDGLLNTVASLPPRGRRREERAEALVPARAAAAPDDEWEEDDA